MTRTASPEAARWALPAAIGMFLAAGAAGGVAGGWVWVALVAAGALTAWNAQAPDFAPARGRRVAIGAVAFFAAALCARLWRISDSPPFYWDEGLQAYDTRCALAGIPLEPLGIPYHRSPVWQWLSVATSTVAGTSVAGLRLLPVLCGSAAAALTFVIGARLAGWFPAALAASWMVLHPWPVNLSRLLMVPAIVPVCGGLVVWLSLALRPGPAAAAAVGAVAGLAVYTYPSALHLPLLAAILPLAASRRWGAPEARLRAAAAALATAAAVVAPSLFWPAGFWKRTAYVSALADPGAIRANLGQLAMHIRCLPVPEARDLFPADPGLAPVYFAPFLLAGCVLLVRKGWREGDWTQPAWLVCALMPALLSREGMEKVFRLGGALPAVALVAAAGGGGLAALAGGWAGRAALAALWVGGLGWQLDGYFHRFLADPTIRTAYRVFDLEAAERLSGLAGRGFRLGAPLPLARFPVERFALFDALRTGRVTEGVEPCANVRPLRVFRNALGWPAAILLEGNDEPPCLEFRTIEDVGLEGDRLLVEGRVARALAYYRKYAGWMPDAPVLWVRLGFAARKAGKPAEALSAFRRAIGLGLGSADAYDGGAAALDEMGRRREAVLMLEEGLRVLPGNPVLREDLEALRRKEAR